MLPPKKDEPGYAEYREQYALCDQSQLVDYATVDIPASSTANNVIGARSTRIMFPTIAFPPMSPFQGPRPILQTAGGQSALTSGPAPAHRRPTRQRPGRCPSTETSANGSGPAARRSAPTRVELPLLRGACPGTTRRVAPLRGRLGLRQLISWPVPASLWPRWRRRRPRTGCRVSSCLGGGPTAYLTMPGRPRHLSVACHSM